MVLVTPSNRCARFEFNTLASVHPESCGYDTLPVCLGRENSHRLVSLWDIVRTVKVDRLVALFRDMYVTAAFVEMRREQGDSESFEEHRALLEKHFQEGAELCGVIGLPVSKLHAVEAVRLVHQTEAQAGRDYQRIAGIFSNNVEKELSLMTYFTVSVELAPYLRAFGVDAKVDDEKIDKAWNSILDSFPSVKFDALESFKALALGRNTACVFHLMRVLELGLTPLGAVFNVSLEHTNWNKAIEQIESHIREMYKDPIWKVRPDCKEMQEFYSQASGHFVVFKDAWRNYTAHARGKFDEQEASDIMTSVRAFMQKLTVGGLHE